MYNFKIYSDMYNFKIFAAFPQFCEVPSHYHFHRHDHQFAPTQNDARKIEAKESSNVNSEILLAGKGCLHVDCHCL